MGMNPNDRKRLLDIRAMAERLATEIKLIQEVGYHIKFNINGATGQVDLFEVMELRPINLMDS